MKAQVNEIEQNLQQFTGTEMYYYIPILRTRFTDGLKWKPTVTMLPIFHWTNCGCSL